MELTPQKTYVQATRHPFKNLLAVISQRNL